MPTLTRTSLTPLAFALAACGAAGSGAGAGSGAKATPAVSNVERFMPLQTNTVSAFETEIEGASHGVLMMRIERPTPSTAVLTVGGKGQRLEIVPEGIRLAAGGWLLKAPLSEGASFKGQFGTVVVSATDKSVQVPAGSFSGCVETIEESVAVRKRVTTVFCPDVGIVVLEAEGSLGDDYGRERAVLRSHGPAVDINQLGPEQ